MDPSSDEYLDSLRAATQEVRARHEERRRAKDEKPFGIIPERRRRRKETIAARRPREPPAPRDIDAYRESLRSRYRAEREAEREARRKAMAEQGSYGQPASYRSSVDDQAPADDATPATGETPAGYVMSNTHAAPANNVFAGYDLPADYGRQAHDDSTVVHDTSYVPEFRYDTHHPPRTPAQIAEERRRFDRNMNRDYLLQLDEEPLCVQTEQSPDEPDEHDQPIAQQFRGVKAFKDALPVPKGQRWWERFRDPDFDPETAHVIPPDQIRPRSPPQTETPVRPSFDWNLAEHSNSIILASTPANASERDLDEQLPKEEEEFQQSDLEVERAEGQHLDEKECLTPEEQPVEDECLSPKEQLLQQKRLEVKKLEEELLSYDRVENQCIEDHRRQQERRKDRNNRALKIVDAMWTKAYVEKGISPDPEVREQQRLEKSRRHRRIMAQRLAHATKELAALSDPFAREGPKAEEFPNGLGITTPEVGRALSPDASTPDSPQSPTPNKQRRQNKQETSETPSIRPETQPSAGHERTQRPSKNATSEQPQQLSSQAKAQKPSSLAGPEKPSTRPGPDKQQNPPSANIDGAQPPSSQEQPQTPPMPEDADGASAPSSMSLTPEELAKWGPHARVEQDKPVRALVIPTKYLPNPPRRSNEDPRDVLRALSRAFMREAAIREAEKRENPSDDIANQSNERGQAGSGTGQGALQQRSMTARLDAASTGIRDAYRITKQLLASIDTSKLAATQCTTCKVCGHVEPHPLIMICTGVKGLVVARDDEGRAKPTWLGILCMILFFWYMAEILISEYFGTTAYASTMDGYGVFPDLPRYPFALVTLISWIPPFSWLVPLFNTQTFHEATRTVEFFKG